MIGITALNIKLAPELSHVNVRRPEKRDANVSSYTDTNLSLNKFTDGYYLNS